MCAVRPSIMSLGLTPSAPAPAASTAERASASSVAPRSMPPVRVEERAVAVRRATSTGRCRPRDGARRRISLLIAVDGARRDRTEDRARAPVSPRARRNSRKCRTPASTSCAIESSAAADAVPRVVAEAGNRLAAPSCPSTTKSGWMSCATENVVSATRSRKCGDCRSRSRDHAGRVRVRTSCVRAIGRSPATRSCGRPAGSVS